MYDTIIVGTGPAGITAAIFAIRREMKVLLVGKEMGGQIAWAGEIENYPGFPSISNVDLITKWQEHLKSAGVETKSAEIQKVEKTAEGSFVLHTAKETFEGKTVIWALGLIPRRLAIPGEVEFSGKGVSYCANCDGPFFRGKTVAVVGGGNSALDAAEVLSKIAKKVYLVHRSEKFRAFEELVDQVKKIENVEILLDTEINQFLGEKKLERIKVNNKLNNIERELEVDGTFIEIGRITHTDVVGPEVKRNEWGNIIVDEKCATTCEGIYAAGDVTQVEFKQIPVAMGQGTIAALSAYQYLQAKQGKVADVIDRSIK